MRLNKNLRSKKINKLKSSLSYCKYWCKLLNPETWFFLVQSHVKTTFSEAGVVDGYPIWMSLNGWHLCFVYVLILCNDHDLRTDWEGLRRRFVLLRSFTCTILIPGMENYSTRWEVRTDVEGKNWGKKTSTPELFCYSQMYQELRWLFPNI